jgi:transcriptional regulator with XRE-family HTH domain
MKEHYWHPSRKTVSPDDLMAFADRLHTRMTELGWTQAELARRAFGQTEDGVVKDRDKVSLYLRGKGLPGEDKMRALAKALGMSLVELAPPISQSPREVSQGRAAARVDHKGQLDGLDGFKLEPASKPGYMTLLVNQRLRIEDAVKVISLLSELARAH